MKLEPNELLLPDAELPEEIDIDGLVDRRGIRFIGKAIRQADGKYVCLADVGGALCRVEVSVTRKPNP